MHDQPLRRTIESHLSRHRRFEAGEPELRAAAVAFVVLRGEAGEPSFILTRRASKLRNHGGQWALPGGSLESGESVVDAALRELEEEVGVSAASCEVLGLLDDYPTRSGFVITPVVVWSTHGGPLREDPSEVAAAYKVPLSDLGGKGFPTLRRIPESERPVLSVPLMDTLIHAPTAAVIYQFKEVAILGRATRVSHFEQPVFAWR